jgi:hypothetical protein
MPNMLICYIHVYGICDHSAPAAVEEYRRFAMRRIPDHRVVCKASNTLCVWGTLPSARVSTEKACQEHLKEQENVREMV